MILADLIKKALETDGVISAYVYGDFGYGKTSYALWTAYEVLGTWDKVLDYLFFEPGEAVRKMRKAVYRGERIPLIIMDDAGLWLDKLTWWEKDKVHFMQFFNLIRSVTAGIIFTTPSEELPRQILNKTFFRVEVRPVTRDEITTRYGEELYSQAEGKARENGVKSVFSLATGYKLKTLPTFFHFVKKSFYDIYPTQYPVYKQYLAKRRRALKTYFDKWARTVEGDGGNGEEQVRGAYAEYISLIRDLASKGYKRREIVRELVEKGVPQTTAYRYVRRVLRST